MSDNAGPLEWRQRYADEIETSQTHLDGRQTQIHTALPGHIVSYDAGKMTASVQIAIQGAHLKIDGTVENMTIKPIGDVPVVFPGGGGYILTFPVAPGDDCLIIFNERNIDNWYQHGGVVQPSNYRMHDITDAVCLVGIRAQPHVLGGGGSLARAAGPPASSTTTQLRSDDGKNFIEIDGASGNINMKAVSNVVLSNDDGSSVVQLLGSGNNNVSLKCQGVMTLDCPTVHITGSIKCDGEVIAQAQTNAYVTLSGHWKHSGNPSSPTPGT